MDAHQRLVDDYESGVGVSATSIPLTTDPGAYLAATLPVWPLAAGSVAAFAGAADRWRLARGLEPLGHKLVPERIAASFQSDKLMRLDGAPVDAFAELSGFFRAADGWIRTHANYPHHRARLLAVLGLPDDTDRAGAAERIATLSAADIEDRAAESGAIAVRVRTQQEWAGSPQGRAAAAGPLIALDTRDDDGEPLALPAPTAMHPLRGLRVLDLTRVISGPVATRALALLGADVLRVDPPHLPELGFQYVDLCQGKRSALLDIRTRLPQLLDLLRTADVLITGYRPGALESAGIAAATTRPGIVHGRVCAWSESGPWGHRRGFDSIVQAASGISIVEAADPDSSLGALPAQALDHATGYLLAAGVLDALTARAADGRGRDVRAALARTGSWLLQAPGRTPDHPPAQVVGADTTVIHGTTVTARPALAEYPDYPWPAHPYGEDEPAWDAELSPDSRRGSHP
ncbi:CoA transferase [Nocardia transvalensis]|uniref:CoA transferase n=1 Tax=Nocardia transvalensis TaxID=37333 RepID=UPI001894D193|nr:CoA transferase [Nocardia transvalensis]MBF6331272.1 CoA transferase [Nocardia transvalensis]